MMKLTTRITLPIIAALTIASAVAQGPRPGDLKESPLDLGEPGIAWYPKLEDGLLEAQRQNKPILFMAAASQCGGVPGVF